MAVVGGVVRGEGSFIPDGDFQLQVEDKVIVLTTSDVGQKQISLISYVGSESYRSIEKSATLFSIVTREFRIDPPIEIVRRLSNE